MMIAPFKRPIRSGLTAAALCVASTIAGLGAAPGAFAAGGIKAAYVETVIPAKPFTRYVVLSNIFPEAVVGVSAGVLGISSITFTNFLNTPGRVLVMTRVGVNGSDCSGTEILTADNLLTLLVPARSTLHLPFPAPISIEPFRGLTCIGFTNSGGGATDLYITVNGFIN